LLFGIHFAGAGHGKAFRDGNWCIAPAGAVCNAQSWRLGGSDTGCDKVYSERWPVSGAGAATLVALLLTYGSRRVVLAAFVVGLLAACFLG
jgi:hypothetical protein